MYVCYCVRVCVCEWHVWLCHFVLLLFICVGLLLCYRGGGGDGGVDGNGDDGTIISFVNCERCVLFDMLNVCLLLFVYRLHFFFQYKNFLSHIWRQAAIILYITPKWIDVSQITQLINTVQPKWEIRQCALLVGMRYCDKISHCYESLMCAAAHANNRKSVQAPLDPSVCRRISENYKSNRFRAQKSQFVGSFNFSFKPNFTYQTLYCSKTVERVNWSLCPWWPNSSFHINS